MSGILFWWPLIGLSLGSKRISLPARIVYLLLAVTPTAVVAAFITLSDGVIYGENIQRLFGIEAIDNVVTWKYNFSWNFNCSILQVVCKSNQRFKKIYSLILLDYKIFIF